MALAAVRLKTTSASYTIINSTMLLIKELSLIVFYVVLVWCWCGLTVISLFKIAHRVFWCIHLTYIVVWLVEEGVVLI